MEEIWKDIDYFNGYRISNKGNVLGVFRNKLLKPMLNSKGYLMVRISNNRDGKFKGLLVHRIIATHFIPNPQNKPQVNHKNGIKTDNRIENLEWTSSSENMLHAWEFNLINSDKKNSLSKKINNEDVKDMLKLKSTHTYKQVANIYGIAESSVWKLLNNQP